MKKFTLVFLMMATVAVYAQPKLIKQAVIHTSTNVIMPEEEDLSEIQNDGNDRGRMFRNFGSGETNSTTYIKNDLVKTDIKSEMIRGSIIRDNEKKITTTLMQIMGKKSAFFATDEDQKEMKRKMDSMVAERRKKDTAAPKTEMKPRSENSDQTEIAYTEETQKIAGYTCKKAYIIKTNFLGLKDSMTVWYNPEIKFEHLPSTGGTSGMGSLMGSNSMQDGFTKVDGFIMKYEIKMNRGRTMEVAVTKIELNKEIKDSEFLVPKGYDVKPISEIGNMFGGRRAGGIMMHRN